MAHKQIMQAMEDKTDDTQIDILKANDPGNSLLELIESILLEICDLKYRVSQLEHNQDTNTKT